MPAAVVIWLPAFVSVTSLPVAVSVPTPVIGAVWVIGPVVRRFSAKASPDSARVPSMERPLADGADVFAPAGTLVKPPAVRVPRPGVMLASKAGPMTNCPEPVPSRLVLMLEKGATSSVPAGAVMVLAPETAVWSATRLTRPPVAAVRVAGVRGRPSSQRAAGQGDFVEQVFGGLRADKGQTGAIDDAHVAAG